MFFRNTRGKVLITLLIVLIFLGVVFLLLQKKANFNLCSVSLFKSPAAKPYESTVEKREEVTTITREALSLEEAFIRIAEEVKPAVVNISTVHIIKDNKLFRRFDGDLFGDSPWDEFFRNFFGSPYQPEEGLKLRSLGSGIIIDKKGYILTNNHVVESADEIKVILAENEEYDAKVIGRDSKTDLAVIKIDLDKDLPTVILGDSDNLRVGQWAIAIGNPFGLHRTVTVGVISATGRVELGITTYENFIQTDASINRGNSGGPLLNIRGEVIGVNTAILGGASGIGFAIPINMAKEILNDLITKGKVTRGWLGVIIQPVTPELKNSFGLQNEKGALISDVLKDSPAEKAGLKRGDVIITFDGIPVNDVRELQLKVAKAEINRIIVIDIIRARQPLTVKVEVGEMPRELPLEEREMTEESRLWLGMKVQEVNPELARQLNLSSSEGVIVTQVDLGSPAEQAGIGVKDIILEINGQSIKNLSDYEKAISSLQENANAIVLVQRYGYTTFMVIKPERKK